MQKYLYLSIDIVVIIVPLLFSFKSPVNFSKKWKYLWPAIGLAAIVFLTWDNHFTSIGVWGFSNRYVTGIQILNLPIEEILFFVCIPYACVFSYEVVNWYWKVEAAADRGRKISWVLVAGSMATGLMYLDRWYTATTFLALSGLLMILILAVKPTYLGRFYFFCLFILVPFLIINGVLTGTGLSEPVFWYNEAETMGIRILTIPVEDVFYGMLLVLVNVSIFEFLQKRFPKAI